MSKIKNKGDLVILVRYPNKELVFAPVHSFEVDGGSGGKIDFTSSDEQKIVCQLQQARTHKNITIYVKQGVDVPSAKIINLSKSEQKEFTLSFIASFMKGGTVVRKVSIGLTASFSEAPIPVGKTPPLLKMKLNLKAPELYYRAGDKRTEEFAHISC